MPRLEVSVLAGPTHVEGERIELRLQIGDRELDVRFFETAVGSNEAHLAINERLASGGIRRLVTETARGV